MPDRFHCVDFNEATNTGIFRSNMPISGGDSVASPTSYARDEILDLAALTGHSECNTDVFNGTSPYILEISLSNALDDKNGLLASRSFW